MSALEDLTVELEANSATVVSRVDELFDENGELRLWEDADGWRGFVREDGVSSWVDRWTETEGFFRKLRVGDRAVRLAVRERIEDPEIGGHGRFVKGASPP